MIDAEYVIEMASYNQWQNQALYALCATLEDEQRKADRAMYFRSIHRTLDHVLLVDRLILDFVESGVPWPTDRRLDRLYDDFEPLREARAAFDAALIARAAGYDDAWLDETVHVWSDRLRRQRRLPRGLLFVQMFNHQTHHRSQVTTHLCAMGLDYGPTDVPSNPHRSW